MNVACRWCGTRFKRTRDRDTFCSYDCAYAARRKPDATPVYFLTCQHCDKLFASSRQGVKQCTTRCRNNAAYQRYRAVQPRQANCSDCGETYLQAHGNVHRCDACLPRRRAALRSAQAAKRRARSRSNGPWEPVDRLAIFIRDNWTCYLCERPVHHVGSMTDPLAPTLDHVMPLALGGAHSAANLRLACRECNSSKGATPLVAPA